MIKAFPDSLHALNGVFLQNNKPFSLHATLCLLFSFRILPLKPAHSPVSVTGLLLKPPHLPAEHQISQRNILSFISSLIPNLIPHPIPSLIPNLQQRRSAAIHVRQPRPPKYSALTSRRRLTSNLSAPPCACHAISRLLRHPCRCPSRRLFRCPCRFCAVTHSAVWHIPSFSSSTPFASLHASPALSAAGHPARAAGEFSLSRSCFTIVSHPFSASYGHMTSRTGLTWSI